MRKIGKTWITAVATVLVVAVATAGCETYGGSAGMGALIGSGAGAIIGNQSGHAGEGALIGAVVGGVTGLIVKDVMVNAQKKRDAQAAAAAHQYQVEQGKRLYAETAQVAPNPVKPGNQVAASMEYSVLGAGSGAPVTEVRTLQRDGKTVATVSEDTFQRTDGTWESTCKFTVPPGAQPGTYKLVQTITVPDGTPVQKDVAFTVTQ
jgi:hypothetical protein